MTEQNQFKVLYETDAYLTENIDDLREHGYEIIHTDDINTVVLANNGEEYQNLIKAAGIEATSELVEHLRDVHHYRARDVLTDEDDLRAIANAQPLVIEQGDPSNNYPFAAAKAAETILSNDPDLENPPNGIHPDDIRDAFAAVAANITRGAEPSEEDLVVETDNYWLARYGPSVTSSIQDAIARELPDERDDYPHARGNEYCRIIRQLVTSTADQYCDAEALGPDEYVLIHVKPTAYTQ